MTIALHIRRLRITDYDAMIRLFRVCGLNPRTRGRESRSAIAAQLRTARNRYLGAFEGTRLVGTVLGTHDGRNGSVASRSIPNIVGARSRVDSCVSANAACGNKGFRSSRR